MRAGAGEIRQRELLIALSVQVALVHMGIGLVSPILPLYAKSFGVSLTLVGLVITVYGLAMLLLDLPAGRLVDRYGRRVFLIGGALLIALSALANGLATEFWHLVLFRLLQGAGSALLNTAAMVSIADMTQVNNRGRILSFYQGSRLFGAGLGPAVGGFLAQYFDLRAPFFFFSAVVFLAALWSFWRIPETSTAVKEAAQLQQRASFFSFREVKALFRNPNFLLIALVTVMMHLLQGGIRSTVLPLFGNQRLGLNAGQLGLAFSLLVAMDFVAIFAAGRLSDRWGRKAVIIPGFLLVALSLVLFALSTNYGFFLMVAVLFGVGRGIAGPAPAAYVADITEGRSYGTSFGLYRTFGSFGLLVGPILGGWVGDLGGLSLPFYFNAALVIAVLIPFWLFAKETVSRERKPLLLPME